MFDESPRVIEFVQYWAHSLAHCAKILGRVGIRVPTEGDFDDIKTAMILALDLIDDRPAPDHAKGAIVAMTLRWLATGEILAAYAETGEQWLDLAFLDSLNQVEGLVALAMAMLDERDGMN
jgi:hypothetical protein